MNARHWNQVHFSVKSTLDTIPVPERGHNEMPAAVQLRLLPPPCCVLCYLTTLCTHLLPVENVNEVPSLLLRDLRGIQILANVLELELIFSLVCRPSIWGECRGQIKSQSLDQKGKKVGCWGHAPNLGIRACSISISVTYPR